MCVPFNHRKKIGAQILSLEVIDRNKRHKATKRVDVFLFFFAFQGRPAQIKEKNTKNFW